MIEAEVVDGANEGEDDGNLRLFRIDPFLQPPILKALFEQLPVEDLAKCRLVSKLWCKESLSTWRSKAALYFDKEGIVSTDDCSKRKASLGEFLDLWEAEEWGSCPFKNFSLDYWDFEAGDVEQQRFLELVGGHLTSLYLFRCSFAGQDQFRRIIYQALPKLQFLKISCCDVDKDPYSSESLEQILAYKEPAFVVHGLQSLDIFLCLPDSMMDMLSHFHRVKSLRLCLGVEGRGYYRDLLEIIRLIRAKDHAKLPLEDFDVGFIDVHGQSASSSIELLKRHEQLHLPFQRLKIYFDPDEDMDCHFNDVFRNILQNHSSTLKQLEFSGDGVPGLCKSFPFGFHLENLEKLYIKWLRSTDNLNFLKYTPNLRVLEIWAYNSGMFDSDNLFTNSSQLEIGDWRLSSLTELELLLPLSLSNLRSLMKWMPNVERLDGLQLDDVKFSMICDSWKKMKQLTDWGRELTDEGVVGVGNAHEAGEEEKTQSVPNITQLKNLSTFSTFSSKITSASVHVGFLKLANLEFVSLGSATKLDDEAKVALEKRNIPLYINPG